MSDQKHHTWCTEFGKVIEGSCPECEELNRRYPATGTLYYPSDGSDLPEVSD